MDSKIEERLKMFTQSSTIDVSKDRIDKHLSLRKKKLNNELQKRRIVNSEELFVSAYQIDCKSLDLSEYQSNKKYRDLKDFLLTVTSLLSSMNDNEISVGIILLKNYSKISDDIVIQETALPKILLNLLTSKMSNIVLVYEITYCLVNLSCSENPKVNIQFVSLEYLKCFTDILKKYENDYIIRNSIFQLLGNLVLDNFDIQKIYYKSKLLDLLIKIIEKPPIQENDKFNVENLWCLACFSYNINSNVYFYHNTSVLLILFAVFKKYSYYPNYLKNCLYGLYTLSISEEIEIIQCFFTEDNSFIKYLMQLPLNSYCSVNSSLCNLASNNIIDDKLIQIGMLDFIIKGIDSNINTIQSQALWSLANLVCDTEKINLIISKGFLSSIFDLAKGYHDMVVESSLEVISNIIELCDIDTLKLLYDNNICGLIVEILAKNFTEDTLLKIIEPIEQLLKREEILDDKFSFLIELEKKGARDLLLQKQFKNNKNLTSKLDNIIDKYFNKNNMTY